MLEESRRSRTAIWSLVLGVFSPLLFLPAIPAVILGHLALKEIDRMPKGYLQGLKMAVAGLVLGYLSIFAVFALTPLAIVTGVFTMGIFPALAVGFVARFAARRSRTARKFVIVVSITALIAGAGCAIWAYATFSGMEVLTYIGTAFWLMGGGVGAIAVAFSSRHANVQKAAYGHVFRFES